MPRNDRARSIFKSRVRSIMEYSTHEGWCPGQSAARSVAYSTPAKVATTLEERATVLSLIVQRATPTLASGYLTLPSPAFGARV
jgi:hypothetical protein